MSEKRPTAYGLYKLFGEDWRDYMPLSWHARRAWSIWWPFLALLAVVAVVLILLIWWLE